MISLLVAQKYCDSHPQTKQKENTKVRTINDDLINNQYKGGTSTSSWKLDDEMNLAREYNIYEKSRDSRDIIRFVGGGRREAASAKIHRGGTDVLVLYELLFAATCTVPGTGMYL